MTAPHESMCVCERPPRKEGGGVKLTKQNRMKAACVSNHTHALAVCSVRHPTPPRIQYNYKRTNESERNGHCIQTDYIGGGRYV
ncbi:hypothetical protein M196_gp09 [Halorubrum tailed virus 4]|uniref:Uncharacterized protein n=1 Tax=Halorubrum tailed virus 4 TaxID=1273752 RepID=R4TG14_9CAUD|nr:hypothetical protein M196_gp09 [Halorubrum tailed virus 4]AGM11166.1 hypothetical protein HRTV4_9 [Halorubrum tailed virus 4]